MRQDTSMTIDRWHALMEVWGFGENPATYEALLSAYSEKGRHYHTHEHIAASLRHLDGCADRLDAPHEVELALWFHDAIYKPFSGSNEKDSADWAVRFLAEEGAVQDAIDRVCRLIMVTEHNAPVQTNDEAALVDIDLAVLGCDPASYALFEKAVRQEYRFVPWFLYRKKRAEILKGFLQRPQIYTAGIFADEVERQARKNLANALVGLAG